MTTERDSYLNIGTYINRLIVGSVPTGESEARPGFIMSGYNRGLGILIVAAGSMVDSEIIVPEGLEMVNSTSITERT